MTAAEVAKSISLILGNYGIAPDGSLTAGKMTYVGMGNGKRVTISVTADGDASALASQVSREMAGQ